MIERAVAEYRLAETGWNAYIEQDPTSLDVYESRFWLADSRYWVVVLQVTLGRTPTPQEVTAAREAAVAVRDSNEDDKYIQPSAYYVVAMAEKVLEDAYRRYEASNGREGVERRDAVRFDGEGASRKVDQGSGAGPGARGRSAPATSTTTRIPVDRDPQRNGLLYAFQSADLFFVYGQFADARKRFKPLYDQYCGKNEWGYKAWEKLISMSNFEGDADESRRARGGQELRLRRGDAARGRASIRKPVKAFGAYLDARRLYEAAEKMPDGPARNKKWREAAAAYKVALDAAPDRDEAPEAAMNGAYAYKQVGEYDKAIEMYELFIARYGSEKTLAQAQERRSESAAAGRRRARSKYEERAELLEGRLRRAGGCLRPVLQLPAGRADLRQDQPTLSTSPSRSGARRRARRSPCIRASDDRGGMNRSRASASSAWALRRRRWPRPTSSSPAPISSAGTPSARIRARTRRRGAPPSARWTSTTGQQEQGRGDAVRGPGRLLVGADARA